MTTIAPPMPRAGPVEWLLATDHKRTAARMAVAAFGFFIASGVLALLMRSELAQPGLQIVSTDTYNQLFTMHGSGMIYLVVTPLARYNRGALKFRLTMRLLVSYIMWSCKPTIPGITVCPERSSTLAPAGTCTALLRPTA